MKVNYVTQVLKQCINTKTMCTNLLKLIKKHKI